ncbi:hypothetical protein BO94DRAFT_555414 [Aspergillus sclerotioniger CBS 115572]|uniref:Protein kinase domain-containing protein n=1 Tax=Aspergillus sclerotioniger CBS 115572 TaxID=1450535 RepID=A0A317X0A8_9EURO|nr:hypothetical protein BO94DRAFT_555414 [Aspergillus sclerotioniger CBS 115572]PWY91601.1 hypothetical protein BO94DRAFT_555414 [Aspergillus sclerotioniger CBS 115572]
MSLVPGFLLRGARSNYRILRTMTGDNTHISTIFKAAVVPHENARQLPDAPNWAIIKVADAKSMKCMTREQQVYHFPGVASAECFRKMYDVIDDNVRYQPDQDTDALIMSFLRATLTSCVVLESHQHVNTEFKPSNILISNLNTDSIITKVDDLGLVVPSNSFRECQPFAMRAPEVYLGAPCTEPSQVWAIAAMILEWVKPDWDLPRPEDVDDPIFKEQVAPDLGTISPFDKETRKVEMPQELRDLLRYMMVLHPEKRPSAMHVLASKEFRDFERFVGSWFG